MRIWLFTFIWFAYRLILVKGRQDSKPKGKWSVPNEKRAKHQKSSRHHHDAPRAMGKNGGIIPRHHPPKIHKNPKKRKIEKWQNPSVTATNTTKNRPNKNIKNGKKTGKKRKIFGKTKMNEKEKCGRNATLFLLTYSDSMWYSFMMILLSIHE